MPTNFTSTWEVTQILKNTSVSISSVISQGLTFTEDWSQFDYLHIVMTIPGGYSNFAVGTIQVAEVYWALQWCNGGSTKGDRNWAFINQTSINGYDAVFGFCNLNYYYPSNYVTRTKWDGSIIFVDRYQPTNIVFDKIIGIRRK